MTHRLIALMSLVLLLCLATFAFATKHYHDEIMDEVQQTVAEVGQMTFRSLDDADSAAAAFVKRKDGVFPVAPSDAGARGYAMFDRSRGPNDGTEADTGAARWLGSTADDRMREIAERVGSARRLIVLTERLAVADAAGDVALETRTLLCDPGNDCRIEERIGDDTVGRSRIIAIDSIRAEPTPGENAFVLRIPTMLAGAVEADADAGAHAHGTDLVMVGEPPAPIRGAEATVRVERHGEPGDGASGGAATGSLAADAEDAIAESAGAFDFAVEFQHRADGLEDIVLEVPTGDYRELLADLRGKSVALAGVVFAVGLVLTAGVASRFTRPARRLDAAIRRLSEGDLDVEVPVRGKDELARLGHAFNTMTARLRASRRREREMTRRDKLSALGRLAASVAHDVRNPLHSINLTLEHLNDTGRPEREDARREFDRSLGIIRGEIRRLDGLVGNFLRFAAGRSSDRERVALGSLLRETVRLVEKEAEWRGITLEVDDDGRAPAVDADLESLRSAILNLVLNGFEAMPEGGHMRVALGRDGEGARLEIADDGVGIPKEDLERIFDFGYSTREGGSGVGLSIVHQCVVEDHGGGIRIDSKPGRGTCVTLSLPAAGDPAGTAERENDSEGVS